MVILSTLLITKRTEGSKGKKAILYIGGDYHTDATVTPVYSPNRSANMSPYRSPGTLTPPEKEKGGVSTPKLAYEVEVLNIEPENKTSLFSQIRPPAPPVFN